MLSYQKHCIPNLTGTFIAVLYVICRYLVRVKSTNILYFNFLVLFSVERKCCVSCKVVAQLSR